MSSNRPLEPQAQPLTLVQLIVRAVESRATDLMVSTGRPMALVAGALTPIDEAALTPEHCKRLLYEIMTEQQIDQLERENDVVFSVALRGICRVRVAILMQRGTVAATLRLLPATVRSLPDLGFSTEPLERLTALTRLDAGLVLVAGDLGSGKTSTLAALVSSGRNPVGHAGHHRTADRVRPAQPAKPRLSTRSRRAWRCGQRRARASSGACAPATHDHGR